MLSINSSLITTAKNQSEFAFGLMKAFKNTLAYKTISKTLYTQVEELDFTGSLLKFKLKK